MEKEVFKPNLNGSMEQRRMEAQKRKDLPDGLVFSKVKGVVEMHPIGNIELQSFKGTIDDFVKVLLADIKKKNDTIKLQNEAIFSLDERLKKLEKVVKDYGLE